jgi:hypothetical protein
MPKQSAQTLRDAFPELFHGIELLPHLQPGSPLLIYLHKLLTSESDGDAIKIVTKVRRILRKSPGAVSRPRGRPQGTKSVDPVESYVTAWAVDVAGIKKAHLLDALPGRNQYSSWHKRWLDTRLERGRKMLPPMKAERKRLSALPYEVRKEKVLAQVRHVFVFRADKRKPPAKPAS